MKRYYAGLLGIMLGISTVFSACGQSTGANATLSSDTTSLSESTDVSSGANANTPPDQSSEKQSEGSNGPGNGEKPESGPGGSGGPGGERPEDGSGGPGGERPEGGPGGPGGSGGPGMQESDMAGTGNSVNSEGLIAVSDNSVTASEDLSSYVSQSGDEIVVKDMTYSSGDYSTTLISASDSTVSVTNASVNLTVDNAIEGSEQAGTALYTNSGTTIIENSNISVDGAGRYTVAATDNATMAVRSSVITAGGDNGANGNTAAVTEPSSNAGLLIAGTSRANFSVGQSHTFYYDSVCAADGWAALSTDSATGNGLELVAVDTEAIAVHGGYGIYSDSSCRGLCGLRQRCGNPGQINFRRYRA